jgi:Na+/melibiose symporter-like transporter
MAAAAAFTIAHFFIGLIVLIILLFPIIKILQKAGYSGWWVLLWFLPIGNIVALWIFAFADWPALRRSPS